MGVVARAHQVDDGTTHRPLFVAVFRIALRLDPLGVNADEPGSLVPEVVLETIGRDAEGSGELGERPSPAFGNLPIHPFADAGPELGRVAHLPARTGPRELGPRLHPFTKWSPRLSEEGVVGRERNLRRIRAQAHGDCQEILEPREVALGRDPVDEGIREPEMLGELPGLAVSKLFHGLDHETNEAEGVR